MTVEEVKTQFTADVAKYKKDIQDAQKVLAQFVKTTDTSLNKKQASESKLALAVQKTAQEQAKALRSETQLRSKAISSVRTQTASQENFGRSLYYTARQAMMVYAAVRSVASIAGTGIGFNSIKEDAKTAFTVMYNSASIAQEKLKEIHDFSVRSPLSFTDAIASAKQFAAYGFGADELVPTLNKLGTVALATGGRLEDIAYIYGTLKTQGRAYTRDIQQFAMRGIPIYDELANVLGVNKEQIKSMVEEGRVGFREVEKAITNLTSSGGRFGGLLEEYKKTWTGIWSTFKDTAEGAMGTLFSGVFVELKSFFSELTAMMESSQGKAMIRDLAASFTVFASTISTVLQALIPLLPVLTKFFGLWLNWTIMKKTIGLFSGLPKMLTQIALTSMKATKQLVTMTAATGAMKLTTSIGHLTTGIGALATACKSFVLANPWLFAVGAIVAFANIVGQIQKAKAELENAKADPEATTDYVTSHFKKRLADARREQLSSMYERGSEGSPVDDMTALAKVAADYSKSLGKSQAYIAEMLYTEKLITMTEAERLGFNSIEYLNKQRLALGAFRTEQDKAKMESSEWYRVWEMLGGTIDEAVQNLGTSSSGQKFLPGKIGKEATSQFMVGTNADPGEFIKDLMVKPETSTYYADYLKSIGANAGDVATAYTDALSARHTETENALKTLLTWYPDSATYAGTKKALADYLAYIDTELGKSKKGKGLSLDPWFDIDWINKATSTKLDDLDTEYAKARENAAKLLEDGQITAEQNERALGAMKIYYAKETAKTIWDEMENGNEDFFTSFKMRTLKMTDTFKNDLKDAWPEHKDGESMFGDSKLTDAAETVRGVLVTGFTAMKQGALILGNSLMALSQGTEIGKILSMFKNLNGAMNKAITNIAGNAAKALGGAEGDSSGEEGSGTSGAAAGFAAGPIVGIIMMVAGALLEYLGSLEKFGEVLNPITTMIEAMGGALEPFLELLATNTSNMLKSFGQALAKVLPPFLSILTVFMDIMEVIFELNILVPLQLLGEAFTWMNDKVIVPVGNAIIDVINGIIRLVNKLPGVEIAYLEHLKKTTDAFIDFEKLLESLKDGLSATIDFLANKLEDLINERIESLQDLYEVGAISGAEYTAAAAGVNQYRIDTDLEMVSLADQQLSSLGDINARLLDLYDLQEYIDENEDVLSAQELVKALQDAGIISSVKPTVNTAAAAASAAAPSAGPSIFGTIGNMFSGIASSVGGFVSNLFSWDVGTPSVPADTIAQVHKGEGIVPATFMDSIRAGELSLSGAGASSGSTTVTNVTVQVSGSVLSENDLIEAVSKGIARQTKRGYI